MALLLLVGLVVVGLVVYGVMLGIGGMAVDRDMKDAAKIRASLNPEVICDDAFSGSPTVTYEVTPRTLPFDVVVSGALARGYKLEAQQGGTLVFSRQTPA